MKYTTITLQKELATKVESIRKKENLKKKADVIDYLLERTKELERILDTEVVNDLDRRLRENNKKLKVKKKVNLLDIKVEDAYL